MEVQTRSEETGLLFFTTLADAFKHAKEDETVWKISFPAWDGSRVRLIKTEQGWLYEDIMGVREK